jgi:hypothetical protein
VTKGVLWLRVSSVVSLLFAVGHTLGGFSAWSPNGENEVLASMRAVHFDVQGVSRSFMDFYRGFGYTLSVFMLVQAVLLWQLAALAVTQPQAARSLVTTIAVASLVNVFITLALIFPTPAVFAVVLTICLVMAVVTLASRTAEVVSR